MTHCLTVCSVLDLNLRMAESVQYSAVQYRVQCSTEYFTVQCSTVPEDGGVYLGLVGDEGGVDPGPVHRAGATRGGGHQVQHQQDLALRVEWKPGGQVILKYKIFILFTTKYFSNTKYFLQISKRPLYSTVTRISYQKYRRGSSMDSTAAKIA